MELSKISHAAQRKAFELALSAALKKNGKGRGKGYTEIVDAIEKVLGDAWKPEAYNKLRRAVSDEGKWKQYFDNLLDNTDPDYLKGMIMSILYEGAFSGFRATRKTGEELGMSIPWIILFDPTSSCNLHCEGCWASEYGKTLNLSAEDMDDLVSQGKELGIHEYLMTGGEPLCRKKDVIELALKHQDCGFMIFTNGTLVDQAFCEDLKRCKNIIIILSIEGFSKATDARRGKGVFAKVTEAMGLMKRNGLLYGTSICYTRDNIEAVTSDDFYDFLIDMGVSFSWYFHYMPVGNNAAPELMPTPEQRKYMYNRIRKVRSLEGGKPIFLMDFQNDAEFVGGCVAGGRIYCHVNPNGDVEPCVFIHYSGANIHDKTLRECLAQPLFSACRKNQPFNKNMLRPCPMLENPQILRELVDITGARSTDMLSEETCDHLCGKCDAYAIEWKPVAEELWKQKKDKVHAGDS